MPQIFSPGMNTAARWGLILLPFAVIGVIGIGIAISRSPYYTREEMPIAQPVPFSHEHHVSGLGIDCRYCHTHVERGPNAGMPPTHTCMSCHSQIWTNAPALEPVRESFRTGRPIHWNRVVDLPDHVYFNHSIHIQKGVSCVTCHGRVDRMPLMWKAIVLTMSFCVECHRNPYPNIRPREEITNLEWVPEGDPLHQGREFLSHYGINTTNLTDCTRCHR